MRPEVEGSRNLSRQAVQVIDNIASARSATAYFTRRSESSPSNPSNFLPGMGINQSTGYASTGGLTPDEMRGMQSFARQIGVDPAAMIVNGAGERARAGEIIARAIDEKLAQMTPEEIEHHRN